MVEACAWLADASLLGAGADLPRGDAHDAWPLGPLRRAIAIVASGACAGTDRDHRDRHTISSKGCALFRAPRLPCAIDYVSATGRASLGRGEVHGRTARGFLGTGAGKVTPAGQQAFRMRPVPVHHACVADPQLRRWRAWYSHGRGRACNSGRRSGSSSTAAPTAATRHCNAMAGERSRRSDHRQSAQQGQGRGRASRADFAALQGYTHALTMDSDGQHPASHIPEFMAASMRAPDCMFSASRCSTRTRRALRRQAAGRSRTGGPTSRRSGAASATHCSGSVSIRSLHSSTSCSRERWMRRFDFDPEAAVRLSGWRQAGEPAGSRQVSHRRRRRSLAFRLPARQRAAHRDAHAALLRLPVAVAAAAVASRTNAERDTERGRTCRASNSQLPHRPLVRAFRRRIEAMTSCR